VGAFNDGGQRNQAVIFPLNLNLGDFHAFTFSQILKIGNHILSQISVLEMGNEASQGVQLGKPIENDVKVSWKRVDCEPSFQARDCHAACSVNGRMFTFGGVMITPDNHNDCAESDDLLMLEIGEI
jgi:hypothetical protein